MTLQYTKSIRKKLLELAGLARFRHIRPRQRRVKNRST